MQAAQSEQEYTSNNSNTHQKSAFMEEFEGLKIFQKKKESKTKIEKIIKSETLKISKNIE